MVHWLRGDARGGAWANGVPLPGLLNAAGAPPLELMLLPAADDEALPGAVHLVTTMKILEPRIQTFKNFFQNLAHALGKPQPDV